MPPRGRMESIKALSEIITEVLRPALCSAELNLALDH
jgi:hypothetical protein